MTDVTVAPEGGAPAVAPSNEVAVDQSPVQSPNPVGPQTPDKPDTSTGQPPNRTRREAIQAAFDRATKQQDSGEARKPPASRSTATPKVAEAKAADAKPGHNQPPEQTPPEKAAQPRGDRGQFAPRQDVNARQNAGLPQAAKGTDGTPPESSIRTLPEHAPYRDPPARVSERARADWADTPESVRGDVHRMHQEFAKAYQYYKGSHEAFQPIQRFHKMAQEHGTTLEKALTAYTGMEAKLKEDVVAGLDTIVNNLGLKTTDGQPIGLRDIAYHVLSQSPEQLRQVQQGNQQTAAAQQIGALHQEIQGLKQAMQQWQTTQQLTYTRSAVDQFAESHPRFDELGELINSELKLGFDLETAYRRAELLRPATQADQTRTTSAQTRTPNKSISGAPDGGPSNGPTDRTARKGNGQAPPSRREAIQRAINRVQGTH